MIAHSQDAKEKPQGKITQFSAAGRDYFRVDTIHGHSKHREAIFCTEANGHLLIWNTGAPNDDGMDAIVGTLDSIAPTPQKSATDSTASMAPQDSGPEGTPSTAVAERPQRVRVSSGVMTGLLIKKVAPAYPEEARTGYIQGTVVLQAEIGKTGDITSLELLDGPIELAGSAVAAVRQWKYRPYLLLGQPAEVETQIRVNYQLAR